MECQNISSAAMVYARSGRIVELNLAT